MHFNVFVALFSGDCFVCPSVALHMAGVVGGRHRGLKGAGKGPGIFTNTVKGLTNGNEVRVYGKGGNGDGGDPISLFFRNKHTGTQAHMHILNLAACALWSVTGSPQ